MRSCNLPVLPIHGEVSAQPTEGLLAPPACPPHSWGGVGAADGGAVGYACLSSPFMGRCRRSRRRGCRLLPPVLPIHGEVSAQPTEGLLATPACPPHSWGGVGAADGGAVGYSRLSSPFMGRCRRSRRRGCWLRLPVLPIHGEVSAQPTEGLSVTPACPPHSWGGVGAADGGAVGYACLSSPFMGRCRRSRRRGCRLLPPVLPIHGEVSAQPTEGLLATPACPPHSWGGVGAADGGAVGYSRLSSPFMGRCRRSRRRGCWLRLPVLPIHGEVSA